MSELYHDGAKCPACGERVGVPEACEGPSRFDIARWLACASCGIEWHECDDAEVARAWFAHGAREQHLREEKSREQGKREAVAGIVEHLTVEGDYWAVAQRIKEGAWEESDDER